MKKLLLLFAATLFTQATLAQVDLADRQRLMVFYNATDGDNWYQNSNWIAENAYYDWQNVGYRDIPSWRVTSLALNNNNLTGEIPSSSIGYLEYLDMLHLGSNNLTGEIPSGPGGGIDLLFRLRSLDLSFNNFTGEIPSHIGNLINLTELYLNNNSLTGEIPAGIGPLSGGIEKLSELRNLDMSNNFLTGEIPRNIGNLEYLETLKLNNNNLTGEIPVGTPTFPGIENLTNLTSLLLWGNNLTGEIPSEIGNLTNLTWLLLWGNNLTGEIPSEISNLTNLEFLGLGSNNLTGEIPTEISNLTNLKSLGLSSNNLTGEIPLEIGNLTNLNNLQLNSNNLTGEIPSEIGNLTNLTNLRFDNNNLTGTIPDFITLTNLNRLFINYNAFQFGDFENQHASYVANIVNYAFSPQAKLSEDTAQIVAVGDNITLEAISSGNNNVYQWYLNNTLIAGETNATLTLNNIQGAQFGTYRCDVTNTIVTGLTLQTGNFTLNQDITTHPDYNDLVALYNATNGDNWVRFGNSTSWDFNTPINTWQGLTFNAVTNRVETITLSSNNLTGTLPPEIGNMTSLKELRLSANDISGEVPLEIWNLTNLTLLQFGNQVSKQLMLSSGIPAQISNLQNLEWLTVSAIPLTQPLQPELFNLPNLTRLTIQFCGLTGTLPAGFATINTVFADGNNFEGAIPIEILNSTGNSNLSITNNLFNFSDLEPLVAANNIQFLGYSPQKTKDVTETQTIASGSTVTFTINKGTSNKPVNNTKALATNQYQWFKDNVAITDANLDAYTITNAQESDNGNYHCEITNSDVPDLVIVRATITLIIDSALSVGDNDFLKNTINIYPNPAQEYVYVKQNNNVTVEELSIYNVLGKKVMSTKASSEKINIGKLSNGIYFLRLKTDKGVASKKLIVSK